MQRITFNQVVPGSIPGCLITKKTSQMLKNEVFERFLLFVVLLCDTIFFW